MQYQEVAGGVLRGVGGESNVRSVECCATRLRFKLADPSKADKEAIEAIPEVIAVVESGGQYQVVIGNRVREVYAELGGLSRSAQDAEDGKGSSLSLGARAIDLVTSIFTPIIWVLAGAALIKALVAIGAKIDPSFAGTTTSAILTAAGDATFQFLPILLAVTAARRFKADQFTSLAIAGALIYTATVGVVAGPKGASLTLKAFYDGGGDLTFLGMPVVMITYLFSVIPIIVAVYAQGHLERLLKRVLPDAVRNVCTPLFTLVVIVPLTFLVIGPLANYLGEGVSNGVTWFWNLSPIVGGVLMGAFWEVFVIFGVHWSFVPITIQQLGTSGVAVYVGAIFPAVLAQGGAAFAVFLRTRDRRLKSVAGSATVSALVAGITEPAIYGVTLRFKKPFILASVAGAVGGGIVGASHSAPDSFVIPGGLTLGSSIGVGNYALFLIGTAVAVVLAFVLTFFTFKDEAAPTQPEAPATAGDAPTDLEPSSSGSAVAVAVRTKTLDVLAPVAGTVVALADIPDKVFASGAVGQGAGVNPAGGTVVAPLEATVVTAMPHAFGLRTDDGVEVLVHVGIDTVKLRGRHFRPAAVEGARVRPGDLLVEFDPEAVRAAGYDPVTVVLVTAQADYADVRPATGALVSGDTLLTLQS